MHETNPKLTLAALTQELATSATQARINAEQALREAEARLRQATANEQAALIAARLARDAFLNTTPPADPEGRYKALTVPSPQFGDH